MLNVHASIMPTFSPQIVLLCALCWASWQLIKRAFAKNDLDRLPGPASPSFLSGNLADLFHGDAWDYHLNIAKKFGRVSKLHGLLGSRQLYVFDPKALHHIIVKDLHIFDETDGFYASNRVIFGDGFFSTGGEQHRKQRKLLNPAFSVAHMRDMIPIFYDVAKKLERVIKLKVAQGNHEVDLLHWMNRAALEMIGQSGLGCSFDPLEEGSKAHPFSKAVQDFVPTFSPFILPEQYLLPIISKIGTPRFWRFVMDLVPWKSLHKARDIVDTFDETMTELFESKKKALKSGDEALAIQVGQAKDIIGILMKANVEAAADDRLPENEVLGQMTTLMFAATDTTSNALSRTLHLLSMHPEVQEKLREEVTEARMAYGEIPYDILSDQLPFMDAVCRETLRLFPPVTTLVRTTRQDAILPFSSPINGVDGREMNSMMVPKGTDINISIFNANRDPSLWGEDSHEWKPERWLSPLPRAVPDAHIPGVYSHLMTFLGGGRSCIGFKFSQLEMKVVLSTLISRFRFSPSEKNIVWKMPGIACPTVEGLPTQPQMPMMVELTTTDFLED